MSKRRLTVVALVWLVAAAVTTGWVISRSETAITVGNAALVGVLVATLLAIAVARVRRG